jgi:DNA-binding MarR family transcriptional regulator
MASGENWTRWNCWAYTEDGVRINEAVPCLERQRDQLRTTNAALVERVKRLEEAGDVLAEIQEGPTGRRAVERWNQAKATP